MSEVSFHFINVGKGNSTIIDFPSERLSVIDVDDSRAISAFERSLMEIQKKAKLTNPIDYIISQFPNREIFRFILTHPDMDHMSGIQELFRKKDVRNFWDTNNNKHIDPSTWSNSPYNEEDWNFYQQMRQSNKDSPRVLPLYRGADSECCWIQDAVEILAPTPQLVTQANESQDYDHLSYVLMVKYAQRKILLGGDATKKVWEDILNDENYGESYIKSDVFLAPNHGSPGHISKDILDVINPDLTIVSVAEGVEYAKELYSKYGIVLSTKHYGDIWIKIRDTGKILFTTRSQNYSDNWYRLKNSIPSL